MPGAGSVVHRFDVCLSFAAGNRRYVEQVARELAKLGVAYFYDFDKKIEVELWGKDLFQHLDAIYRVSALCCVVFISADYAQARWPNHELRSAQARAFGQVDEYILPARFDQTEVPGIRPTDGYVDLRSKSPKQLARMIASKVMQLRRIQLDHTDVASSAPPKKARSRSRLVLGPGVAAAVSLIVLVTIVWVWPFSAGDDPTKARMTSSVVASITPETSSSVSNPTASSVGRATIRVTAEIPGGCSNTYHIDGEVLELPTGDSRLWVVSALLLGADSGYQTLYFPKTRIDFKAGHYAVDVPASLERGSRNGKHVLVAADKSADAELQLSYESNHNRNDRYHDTQRTHLPVGAVQIASSRELEQKC